LDHQQDRGHDQANNWVELVHSGSGFAVKNVEYAVIHINDNFEQDHNRFHSLRSTLSAVKESFLVKYSCDL